MLNYSDFSKSAFADYTEQSKVIKVDCHARLVVVSKYCAAGHEIPSSSAPMAFVLELPIVFVPRGGCVDLPYPVQIVLVALVPVVGSLRFLKSSGLPPQDISTRWSDTAIHRHPG